MPMLDSPLFHRAWELPQRSTIWEKKQKNIDEIISFCHNYPIKIDRINAFLEQHNSTPLQRGCKLFDLLVRPELNLSLLSEEIDKLKELIDSFGDKKEEIAEAAEIEMKYSGYIEREKQLAEKMQRLEAIKIKGNFNYEEISSLSTEARQKLTALQPTTLGQASRIPGVSPSDISVLLVLLGR